MFIRRKMLMNYYSGIATVYLCTHCGRNYSSTGKPSGAGNSKGHVSSLYHECPAEAPPIPRPIFTGLIR
jgi:hypothetical protein